MPSASTGPDSSGLQFFFFSSSISLFLFPLSAYTPSGSDDLMMDTAVIRAEAVPHRSVEPGIGSQ